MSFSFDELIPNATVRMTKIGDMSYMSVRDLIKVFCSKDDNQTAEIWRRIPEVNKNEVKAFCCNFKFPGRGQQIQPIITMEGVLKLLMWLPGHQAESYRIKATDIIKRYMAGDASLVKEIQANAKSTHPVCQMARESLGPASSIQPNDELLQLDKYERTTRIKLMECDIKAKTLSTQINLKECYESLCPNKVLDDRARIIFKDGFLNLFTSDQKLVTTGDAPVAAGDKPITLSDVAVKLGLRLTPGELQSVGSRVANAYRTKYNESPPKHEQFVDGAARSVCSYTEKDLDWIQQIITSARADPPPVGKRTEYKRKTVNLPLPAGPGGN